MIMKKLLPILTLFMLVLTLFACSERVPEVKLSFESNGGTYFGSYEGGKVNSEPVPEKSGYIFEGWYLKPDFSGDRVIFPYEYFTSTTLYARYTDILLGNEELSFTENDDGYEVSAYTGSSARVVIPAMHDNKPVVKLCDGFIATRYYIEELYFTGNLETIEEEFGYFSKFSKFILLDDSDYFSVDEGVLFSADGKELICYPPANAVEGALRTKYALPDGVEIIAKNAFRRAVFLEKIILSSSLKTVDETFNTTTSLKAFEGSGSNYSTSDGVLLNADMTAVIRYPMNRENPVYTVPSTVVEIRTGALQNTNIKVLNIQEKVSQIEDLAELNDLEEINVATYNQSFYSVDGVLFSVDKKLVKYPAAREGANYVVPDGVTAIVSHAFSGLINLKTVRIGAETETVEPYAFGGGDYSSLERVEFAVESRLSYIGAGAFFGCDNLKTLVLGGRRPPSVETSELAEIDYIFVPGNALALYAYTWGRLTSVLGASEDKLTEYTVTFNSLGGSKVDTMICASLVDEPVATKSGFVFMGWYTAVEGGERVTFPLVVEEDVTLYARYSN